MRTAYHVVLCFTALGYSQNLLGNPGFEEWSGGIPDAWLSDSGILLYQEQNVVHGGSFSARESLFTQNQEQSDLTQGFFNVQANREYTFSLWVFDDDPAGRIRHGIQWFPDGSVWNAQYSQDSAGWQQLTLTEISPADAESALVLIRAYDNPSTWDGDAILYVDDVSFEPSVVQPPVIIRAWHIPVNPETLAPVSAYGYVCDDGMIVADTLFYGVNGLENPQAIANATAGNDTFRFTIPGHMRGDTIFYFMKFVDNDNQNAFSDTFAYYVDDLSITINEVLYDTPGVDSGCFIELQGSGGSELDAFSLVGIRGSSGTVYVEIDLSGYVIPGDGLFVIAQDAGVPNHDLVTPDVNLQNGPDNIELRFHGITIDALGYGDLDGWHFTGEWLPASDVPAAHSLGRFPNGFDSDNNSTDFHDYIAVSPGVPNPEIGIGSSPSRAIQPRPFSNPVRSGIILKTILADKTSYPIVIYSVAGQAVDVVASPDEALDLASGIYFVRCRGERESGMKVVVLE